MSVGFHQEILSAEFAERGAVGPQGNRSRFFSCRGRFGFVFASIESAPLAGRIVYVLRSDARVVRVTGMRDQDESLNRVSTNCDRMNPRTSGAGET